jgi:hypothetical protein
VVLIKDTASVDGRQLARFDDPWVNVLAGTRALDVRFGRAR